MFLGNKKKKEEAPKPLPPDLNFSVRNMPKPRNLSGASYHSESPKNNIQASSAAGNNFQRTGLIIILGGIVVVGALVYLSYRLIIKPSADRQPGPAISSPADSVAPNEKKEEASVPAIPDIVAPSSTPVDLLISSSSPEEISATSSSATTTNDDLVNAPEPVVDSDADGLSDEEEAVFGTNANSADSDGDTYVDLDEIRSNYDPASAGRLAGNVNLARYVSRVGDYQVIYPKNWSQESLDDGRTVIFQAPDSSLLQISLQDNTDKQGIVGWYGSAFPSSLITYDKLQNGSDWEGIWGDDNLNFYLADGDRKSIYVISYIPFGERLAYTNIFQMLISSLQTD